MDDDRILFRVLIASSNELQEEREALDRLIAGEIAARPDVARNFRLACLRWDRNAVPTAAGGINDQIDESLDLEDVDLVIALLWRKVGAGTRQEIERALSRFAATGRPRLLVYRKLEPRPSSGDASTRWQDVEEYCRDLVDRDQIVSQVSTRDELVERVREHLPTQLPAPRHAGEPASPVELRRKLMRAGLVGASLSVAVLVLCTTMSFPVSNVSSWRVLSILLATPVLAIFALVTRWFFGRFLDSFVASWLSPRYRDAEAFRPFDILIPVAVLPQRVQRSLPRGAASDVWRWGLAALLLAAPVVAQHTAIFEDILLWEMMIGNEVVVAEAAPDAPRSPRGEPCAKEPSDNREPVESCYVDRRPHGRWPLGLQDPVVKAKYATLSDPIVFVHAEGGFATPRGLPPGRQRHANRGPQVFPPWQSAIYLALLLLSASWQAHGLWRLGRLGREIRPQAVRR